MSSTNIRITNTTNNNLSLVGENGVLKYKIGSVGSGINYVNISVFNIISDTVLYSNLETWESSSTIVLSYEGTTVALNQISSLLILAGGITVENTDVYINSSTGSDASGDGSAALPYATIVKGYNAIPKKIIHRVRILITAGTYTDDFPEFVNNEFSENGSLAFIGVGTPVVTTAGPFTLTGVANVGSAAGLKLSAAAAGFTVDAHYGKFARMLDGSRINDAYPVFANDADDIWSVAYTNKPSPADTFDIIKPAVNVSCSQTTFNLSEHAEVWTSGYKNARVAIVNMNLDFSSSTAGTNFFTASGTGYLWLDFVRFIIASGAYKPIVFIGGPTINYYLPFDTTLAAASNSNITQIGTSNMVGFTIERSGGPVSGSIDFAIYGDRPNVRGVVCRGDVSVFGTGCLFLRCAFGRLLSYAANLSLTTILLYGKSSSVGFAMQANSSAVLDSLHVLTGTSAISCKNSTVSMEDCSCESTLTGYGMVVDAVSRVAFIGATVPSGVSGDVQWLTPNPATTATWPAADGVSVNDGHGSYVVRSD